MEGKTGQTNPYQEKSFFFVGVICPMRAVKGELQHPTEIIPSGVQPSQSLAQSVGETKGEPLPVHSPKCSSRDVLW
jgi:hypothetical protein